ncbi:NACHT domain-containing protein [Streptomyces bambusae]|uniref:NACHT domain-containing protein n=1 Tax=Streptomyces bambusae TaxID=1550616 RepID=UPI001D00059A|nr:NACHT domain-containing protein [Streptomyces bambusae]MCB5169931.1 NACHT domain-containing protein [Streptomyces bambusae]
MPRTAPLPVLVLSPLPLVLGEYLLLVLLLVGASAQAGAWCCFIGFMRYYRWRYAGSSSGGLRFGEVGGEASGGAAGSGGMGMRGRGGRTSAGVLVGVGVVVLLVLLGRGVGGGFGAGDPVASVVGGLAGVGGLALGWRQWRAQGPESDPDAVAVRLARKVAVVEQRALRALLGGDLEGAIDVGFDVEAVGAVDLPAVPPGGWGVAGIAGFYRQVDPGRLVIIGSGVGREWDADAGAGKTVAAVTLCADLAQGHRDRPGPVPVRLSAASWSGASLEEWLQEQLVGVWRLRPREAAAVVEARLVLPVIDGVDEMDRDPSPGLYGAVVVAESRAAALLNMVTAYAPGPVVLTCRTRHYAALADVGKEVRRTAVLTLLPVTGAQAAAYLEDRVAYNPRHYARWHPVLEALTRAAVPGALQDAGTAGLRTALTNPWRLTLAALVYQDTDPATGTLRDPARLLTYAAGCTLQAHLLDGFVTAAVHAHAPAPGRPRRTRPGTRVARTRRQRGGTWPYWPPTSTPTPPLRSAQPVPWPARSCPPATSPSTGCGLSPANDASCGATRPGVLLPRSSPVSLGW